MNESHGTVVCEACGSTDLDVDTDGRLQIECNDCGHTSSAAYVEDG